MDPCSFKRGIPKKTCDLCGKKVSSRYFKEHVRIHEAPESHTCFICGANFTRRASYRYHMKTHKENVPTCDICGKTSQSMELFKKHTAIHFRNDPLQCLVCGVKLKYHSSLLNHLLMHEEAEVRKVYPSVEVPDYSEKDLEHDIVCRICNKKFMNLIGLRNHERVHKINETIRCKSPTKSSQDTLNASMDKITLCCIECNEDFMIEQDYNEHVTNQLCGTKKLQQLSSENVLPINEPSEIIDTNFLEPTEQQISNVNLEFQDTLGMCVAASGIFSSTNDHDESFGYTLEEFDSMIDAYSEDIVENEGTSENIENCIIS